MIRAEQGVADALQGHEHDGPELSREIPSVRQSEGWAIKRESERSLADEMLRTSAWTGLRARPDRDDGQERSR
jgi:hypothetical protein